MGLSRAQVIATAVDILRRYGLADLSMRRLARELDVQPGALYWHVANKQELLVEVAAALLEQVPEPSPDAPAAEALGSLAMAIREALVRVPDAAEVVSLAYAVEPGAARPLRDLARLVTRVGVPAAERNPVAELLLHHILGSVSVQQNLAHARAESPVLDEGGPGRDEAEAVKAFEVGLAVILRGIRA